MNTSTFKEFVARNWWLLLIVLVKVFNQSESLTGSVFLDSLIIVGVVLFLMYTYWLMKYGDSSSLTNSANQALTANADSTKKVATVTIKFYGEDKASVEYTSEAMKNSDRERDLVEMFTRYYAKMLFNLDKGQVADELIKYITTASVQTFNDGTLKRPHILSKMQELIEVKSSGITKTYSGELHENKEGVRGIQTFIDTVGTGYYAPMSTVVFMQYLINMLSDNALLFLAISVAGMSNYYSGGGDYSKMEGLFEAPVYGMRKGIEILAK